MHRKKRSSVRTDKLSIDAKKGGKVVKKQIKIVKQLKPTNVKCSKCSKPIIKLNSSKAHICVTCLKKESSLISNRSKKVNVKQSVVNKLKQTSKPTGTSSSLKSNCKSPKTTNPPKRNSNNRLSEPSSSRGLISTRKTNVKTNVTNIKEQTKAVSAQLKLPQRSAKTSKTSTMNLRGNKRSYVHLASSVVDSKDLKKRKISANTEELTKRESRNKKPTVKGSEWLSTVRSRRVSNYQEDKLKKEVSTINNKSPKSKIEIKKNQNNKNSGSAKKTKKNTNSKNINNTDVNVTSQTKKPKKRTIKNKENQLSAKSKKQNISTKPTIPPKNKNTSLRVAKASQSKGKSPTLKQDNLASSIKKKFIACFTEKKCPESSDVPENVIIAQYIVDGLLDLVNPSIEGTVSRLPGGKKECVLDSTMTVEEKDLERANESSLNDKANNKPCSTSEESNQYEDNISNTKACHVDCNTGRDVHNLKLKKHETNVQLQSSDKSKSNQSNDKGIIEQCEILEENEHIVSLNNLKDQSKLKATVPEKVENCDNSAFENSLTVLNVNRDKESSCEKPISTGPCIAQISNLKDTNESNNSDVEVKNTTVPLTLKLEDSGASKELILCSGNLPKEENMPIEALKIDNTLENGSNEKTVLDEESKRCLKENDNLFESSHHPTVYCASSFKDTIAVEIKETLDSNINKKYINFKDSRLVEDDDKFSELSRLGKECNGQVEKDLAYTHTPIVKTKESEPLNRETFSDSSLVDENLKNNMTNLSTEKANHDCVERKEEMKMNDNFLLEQNIQMNSSNEYTTENVLLSDKQASETQSNKQIDNDSSINDFEVIQITNNISNDDVGKSKENDDAGSTTSSNEAETICERSDDSNIVCATNIDKTIAIKHFSSDNTNNFVNDNKTPGIETETTHKSLDPVSHGVSATTDGTCGQKNNITTLADLTVHSSSNESTEDKAFDSITDAHNPNVTCVSEISSNSEINNSIICQSDELKKEFQKEVNSASLILRGNLNHTSDQQSHNNDMSNKNKSVIHLPTNNELQIQIKNHEENGIGGDCKAVKDKNPSCEPETNDKITIMSLQNQEAKDCLGNGIVHNDMTSNSKTKKEMSDQSKENEDSTGKSEESDVILATNSEANDVMSNKSDNEKDPSSNLLEHNAQLNDQNRNSSAGHNDLDAVLINNSKITENCKQESQKSEDSFIKEFSSRHINEDSMLPTNNSTTEMFHKNSVKDSSVGDNDHGATLPTRTEIIANENKKSLSKCVDIDDCSLPINKSPEVFALNDVIKSSSSTYDGEDSAVLSNENKITEISDQNNAIKDSSEQNISHGKSSLTDCQQTEMCHEKYTIQDSSISKDFIIDNANLASETKICSSEYDVDHCIVLTNNRETTDDLIQENNAAQNLLSIEVDSSSKCINVDLSESSLYQSEDQETTAENTLEEKRNVDNISSAESIDNQIHIQGGEVESVHITDTLGDKVIEHNESNFLQNQNERKKDVTASEEISAATPNETEIKHSLQENSASNCHLLTEKLQLVSEDSQFEGIQCASQSVKREATFQVETVRNEMNPNTDNQVSQLEITAECVSKEECVISMDDDDVESMQCNSETRSSNRMSVDEDNTEMELDPEYATSSCEMKVDASEMSMEVN